MPPAGIGYIGGISTSADQNPDELVAGHVVASLQDGGDWRILYDLLGDPPGNPEAVRGALLLLADYDDRMVVQVALEALVESASHRAESSGDGATFTRPARDEQLGGRGARRRPA
jgi:hypothetical protein